MGDVRLSCHSSLLLCFAGVPELSRFFGIVIFMYLKDHAPPHIHVRYAGQVATIRLAPFEVTGGSLPPRALRLVREWVRRRRVELAAAWKRAESGELPGRIAPLV